MKRITQTINVVKDEKNRLNKPSSAHSRYHIYCSSFICNRFVNKFFPHIKSNQKEDVNVKVSLRKSRGAATVYIRIDEYGYSNYSTSPKVKTPKGLLTFYAHEFLTKNFDIPCGTTKKIYVSITK